MGDQRQAEAQGLACQPAVDRWAAGVQKHDRAHHHHDDAAGQLPEQCAGHAHPNDEQQDERHHGRDQERSTREGKEACRLLPGAEDRRGQVLEREREAEQLRPSPRRG